MPLTNPCEDFVEKFKLYFSAVSVRMMRYAFFNVDDRVVILSNATSQGAPFGDRLTDFGVGELSFHVMKFKDVDFYNNIISVFKIPRDRIYVLNVVEICTLLNKTPINELTMVTADNGDLCIAALTEGETLDMSKTCLGSFVVNNHVIDSVCQWYKYIQNLGSKEHRATHPSVIHEYNPPKKARNFLRQIDISEFGVFNGYRPTVNFILHDGLSLPNIKVFLKDKPITEYVWVSDGCVFIMYSYQDDIAIIRSVRPCVRAVPLQLAECFDANTADLNYKDK